jgi:hypothetical protein
MDISRAVDEFVSSGILLFYHLKAEGQELSKLELHILAAQLQSPTDRNHSSQGSTISKPQGCAVPAGSYTPRF